MRLWNGEAGRNVAYVRSFKKEFYLENPLNFRESTLKMSLEGKNETSSNSSNTKHDLLKISGTCTTIKRMVYEMASLFANNKDLQECAIFNCLFDNGFMNSLSNKCAEASGLAETEAQEWDNIKQLSREERVKYFEKSR